VPGPRNPKS